MREEVKWEITQELEELQTQLGYHLKEQEKTAQDVMTETRLIM